MDRSSLTLTVVVVLAMVVVVIIQAAVVIGVSGNSPPVNANPVAANSPSFWDQYIKPSIGAIVTIVVAFIAAYFAYRRLMVQLRISTRNSFLEMLISSESYRNDLSGLIGAVKEENIEAIKSWIDQSSVYFLFLLKPDKFYGQFKKAIEEEDMVKIHALTRELFTV